jgi:hypothetical protein
MDSVADGLRQLESEGRLTLDDLTTSELFTDTLLHASQAALRTSQVEKQQALRNAVLNAALPKAPDESLQLIFLSLVDQFTAWHLRLLKLFQDPEAFATANHRDYSSIYMGGLSSILEIAYPELSNQREFYDLIWADLVTRGLTNTPNLKGIMTAHGLTQPRTTDIGNRFLRFIESPTTATGG